MEGSGIMKIWKKALCLICLVLFADLVFQQSAQAAASTQLLSQKHGTLYDGERKSFTFQVPVKAKVTVAFVGLLNSDKGTYGDYVLRILDNQKEEVFSREGSISFEDTNFTVTLQKGTYTLVLQEDGGWEFEYLFSIKASATSNVATKSLKLNKKSISLKKGESYNLIAKCTPSYSSDKMTWKSSEPKVAVVSSSGNVKAKSLGQTVITVKKGKKTAKCTVTVNSTYVELDKGKSRSLSSMVKNVKGYKKASWKSANESVASVSKNGRLKCLKHGKTKVTAKISGKTYTIITYVYDHEVLKRNAKAKLKSLLRNPSSLIINKIVGSGNFISIDYSAMNGFGGYNRETFIAWYEEGKLIYFVQ